MSQQSLMSEDEVLQYFIANGGIARNNEIVTHFRTYLANPAIRDEARALFKVIVNKLATVKVENGEKFLVLKRQFFLPIDGNGNPPPERTSSDGQGLGLPIAHPPLSYAPTATHGFGLPTSTQNFIPFPYQVPPPYISNGTYPNVNLPPQNLHSAQTNIQSPISPPSQNFSVSQPQLYGSQFSLIDQQSGQNCNRSPDSDYGLPPPPKQAQRRLSLSSPSSGSPLGGSPGKIPPPYRPPPPAPIQNSPTTTPLPMQPKIINFRSPPPPVFTKQQTPPHPFPQRSLSVSGLNTSPTKSATGFLKEGSHSASPSSESTPFFPLLSPPSSSSSTNLNSTPPPPVPPRAKRSSSFYEKYPAMKESSPDKENENGGDVDTKTTEKISVKERMQKFNKINSENDLTPKLPNGNSRSKREANGNGKHDSGEYDTSSISSYSYGYAPEPKAREWILKAARCDYAGINKMAQENPTLVKRKDINGYTALHWAAKHGNSDLVKLLAGTFKSDVHTKSNGGYTPLHLAAQFSRQDVYDILVQVYNADPNLRDHSGKKPMQYLVRQDTSVSVDTFKKLKEKRRSTEHGNSRDSLIGNSFLRIGSLNVRVKKTTEAFGNFLGKSNSSSQIERMIHKKWGSADSLPETDIGKDKDMMPPPSGTTVYRSGGGGSSSKGKSRTKSRKNLLNPPLSPSQHHRSPGIVSENTTIKEGESGSDSDECGFGSKWKSP